MNDIDREQQRGLTNLKQELCRASCQLHFSYLVRSVVTFHPFDLALKSWVTVEIFYGAILYVLFGKILTK